MFRHEQKKYTLVFHKDLASGLLFLQFISMTYHLVLSSGVLSGVVESIRSCLLLLSKHLALNSSWNN